MQPETIKNTPQAVEISPELKAWFDGEQFQKFQKRDGMEGQEWYALEAKYKQDLRILVLFSLNKGSTRRLRRGGMCVSPKRAGE